MRKLIFGPPLDRFLETLSSVNQEAGGEKDPVTLVAVEAVTADPDKLKMWRKISELLFLSSEPYADFRRELEAHNWWSADTQSPAVPLELIRNRTGRIESRLMYGEDMPRNEEEAASNEMTILRYMLGMCDVVEVPDTVLVTEPVPKS